MWLIRKHVDLWIGKRNIATPRAKTISNWSIGHTPFGMCPTAMFKYSMLLARELIERRSSVLPPARLLLLNHNEKKNHLVTSLLFFSVESFVFLVKFAATLCLRGHLDSVPASNLNQPTTPHLQPKPNHWLPKTSLQRLLDFSQSATSGNPLSAMTTTKGTPYTDNASTSRF